jgi:hypothetical protein
MAYVRAINERAKEKWSVTFSTSEIASPHFIQGNLKLENERKTLTKPHSSSVLYLNGSGKERRAYRVYAKKKLCYHELRC